MANLNSIIFLAASLLISGLNAAPVIYVNAKNYYISCSVRFLHDGMNRGGSDYYLEVPVVASKFRAKANGVQIGGFCPMNFYYRLDRSDVQPLMDKCIEMAQRDHPAWTPVVKNMAVLGKRSSDEGSEFDIKVGIPLEDNRVALHNISNEKGLTGYFSYIKSLDEEEELMTRMAALQAEEDAKLKAFEELEKSILDDEDIIAQLEKMKLALADDNDNGDY